VAIWDRALTPTEINALYNGGYVADISNKAMYSVSTLATNLIAWYRFDESLGDTDSTVVNRAPSPPALTDGTGTNLVLQTVVTPPTAYQAIVYDNLYIQHQIPQSEQQYSWVTASLIEGERIYGLDAPSCAEASAMTTQVKETSYPYYPGNLSSSDVPRVWVNNYVGFVGNLIIDPASKELHVQGIDGTLKAHAGTPSGEFSGLVGDGTSVHLGPGSNSALGGPWNDLIGGADGASINFAFVAWIYPRSRGAGDAENEDYVTDTGTGRVIDIEGKKMLTLTVPSMADVDPDKYRLRFIVDDGSLPGAASAYMVESSDLLLNEWTHVVCQYTYNEFSTGTWYLYLTMFINGQVDDVYQNLTSPTVPLLDEKQAPVVGNNGLVYATGQAAAQGALGNLGFDGYIADLAVIRLPKAGQPLQVLPQAVVDELYNNGVPRRPSVALGKYEAGRICAEYTFDPFGRTEYPSASVSVPNPIPGDQLAVAIDGERSYTIMNRSPAAYGTATRAPDGAATNIYLARFAPRNSVDSLNILTNNRHGPYGWPTWKQIRTGETKVARLMRNANLIGTTIAPNKVPNIINGKTVGFIQPTQPNDFIDFVEAPIQQEASPFYFYFEDNTEEANPENNIMLKAPSFSNEYDYFSHAALNNRLGLKIDLEQPKVYDSIVDFALNSDLSLMMNYSQRIYPSAESAFRATVRGRTAYDINNIYNSSRIYRSLRYGGVVTFGQDRAPAGPVSSSGEIGALCSASSTWPLDPHLYYSAIASVTASDGSGELMNLYGTYQQNPITSSKAQDYPTPFSMPTYALRVPAGQQVSGSDHGLSLPTGAVAFGGDTEWIAPVQAGKDPYKNYTLISDRIRSIAKDYSILPEFRISSHMKYFLKENSGDFLAPLDNIFELSGAAVSNSTKSTFYKTYTNADFLKYFKVVDEDLNEKRSGNLQIVRDKVSLKCDAILKFVPYKGFYPAERALEIGAIFSQSYGPSLMYLTCSFVNLGYGQIDVHQQFNGSEAYRLRPMMEPLMSPGILFNTIKSGLATSDVVVVGTTNREYPWLRASYIATGSQTSPDKDGIFYSTTQQPDQGRTAANEYVASTPGNVLWFGSSSNCQLFGSWTYPSTTMLTKLPFEAIYSPAQFFNENWLSNRATVPVAGLDGPAGQGVVYDRWPSGSMAMASLAYGQTPSPFAAGTTSYVSYQSNLVFTGSAGESIWPKYMNRSGSSLVGPLYTHAIDNFLCETTNMFISDLTSFQSAREEDFRPVVAGTTYSMVMRLYRSDNQQSSFSDPAAIDEESAFEMYSRRSAFGPPVGANIRINNDQPVVTGLSYSHVTPPYYDGEAKVTFTFSASWDGYPTLNDIISNTTLEYQRDELTPNLNAQRAQDSSGQGAGDPNADVRMQIDSSFNLLERLQEVPDGTVTLKDRWLIQSKFETPILNFAGVSTGSVPKETYTATTATASAAQITTRGMWHQYGAVCTGSSGVWATLENASGKSLAEVVGFPVGTPQRVGEPTKEYKLEEAIVAVPFKTVDNRREFIKFPEQEVRIVSEDGILLESYTQPDPRSQTYKNLVAAMDKYVFPPSLNFVEFTQPDAILMYIFEFHAMLNQNDITDIWQNLPPFIGETFEQEETEVEEKELVDLILDKDDSIQWMVFKVKKKAKKDFEVYRRSLVTDNLSAMTPRITSPYSYNWPYDYFSLIELAKIEEEVQYVSADMKEGVDLTEAELLTITKPDPAGRVPPQQPPGTTDISIAPTRKRRGPSTKPRKPSKKPARSPTKPRKRTSLPWRSPRKKSTTSKSGIKTITKVLKKSPAKSKVKKRTRKSRYGKK